MSDPRIDRERIELRVIRVLTNILMLTGSAAALGIFTDASRAAMASVCLFMAVVAVAADRIQHRIRTFPVYTAACLGIAILTAVLGRALMAEAWIPLTAISLAEIRALYGGRVSQKPAFVPQPYCLLLPVLIWMVGTFGEIPMLRALAFVMETGLVLLFLSWHNQKSLERTYMAASERTRVPYRKIRHLNTGLLAVYLAAALLLCAGLTAVCSGDESVFLILEAFMFLFGWIIGSVIGLFMLLASWLSGGNIGAPAGFRPFDPEAAESMFPWLHYFWLAMDGVMIAAGLLLAVYLVYLGLYSFYYGFLAADPETGDTRKRTNAKERKQRTRAGTDRLPLLAGIGPAAGIRRAYISLIRMHPGGTELPGSYTPSQIEYAVAGDEALEEEWREIHELYEKARFAPRQTDRGDLRRMRELVRRRSEEARRRQEMKKRGLM